MGLNTGPRLKLSLMTSLILWMGCMHSEYSGQDIIIQYHLDKIKNLSLIDIPDDYELEYYSQSEEGAYYKIQFQLGFTPDQITDMSDQFRTVRRMSTGPGWGKFPLGWEYFHQPLLDEQFKLRIDTLSNTVEYSYFMAY